MIRQSVLYAVLFISVLSLDATAQDNVEPPWGAANGDIYGRARSDTIPMLFAGGAEFAWSYDPVVDGGQRPAGRSSIVFDAEGNLYWHTDNAKLMSIAPDGTFRWRANDPLSGFDFDFGVFGNSVSPIVGEERVYLLGNGGSGPAGEPVIAAVEKSDGSVIWSTLLPEAVTGDNLVTPILHDGKLYAIGESNGTTAAVYQIDAATGAIDGSTSIDVSYNMRGTAALLPDAFDTDVHGLYVNGDSLSGTDTVGEVFGISVDSITATAVLQWQSDAGKVARSHVIANPDAVGGARLYTHTWADYGGTFYSIDPLTGAVTENGNVFNSGHGFYDVGSLSFDDATIIAGGFDGRVVSYLDDGTGTTTDTVFQFNEGLGDPSWYGEYRALGQLLQDAAGNEYLISGTNSRVNDFGSLFTARACVLDISNADSTAVNVPLVAYDTASQADNWFTIYGGPLVGPDGKLYYVSAQSGLLVALEGIPTGTGFRRADANDDGAFDISDAVFSLGALFVPGSPAPACDDAVDSNDDGTFDISDAIYSLGALFVPMSPAPPSPHPNCGDDPTPDGLECAAFSSCP